MRHQILWSNEDVLLPALLLLLLLTGVVRSGQPISGLPDDGGFDMPERSDGTKVGHLRHAFSILEPELAQAVWSREGLKNPIRRTTTIPLNDRLDIGNTGELQPKGANKPMKRMPRTAEGNANEYDTLNDDFLTEYDLLNLDFSLDEPQDGKKSAKEVEVPSKEFEWGEGQKRSRTAAEDNFPPKEWWDLEEPTEVSSTATTTKRPMLRGVKLFEVEGDQSGSTEEHSLAAWNSRKRESGRVRRGAKTKSAGQTHRGIGEWSGEAAIGRDEVKIWPKLVPIRNKNEPRPIHWPPALTTRRPQATPMEMAETGRKRISGGNDAGPSAVEIKREKKKEEVFRDLPSGVEVVASLVEKAVDNRQQSRNSTAQRQKLTETVGKSSGRGRTEPKKQKRPATPPPPPPQQQQKQSKSHILDRDSPEPTNSERTVQPKNEREMSTKGHWGQQQKQQIQEEKTSQKQEELDRLLSSLPTITIIGGPSEQNPSENEAINASISNGNENAEQNDTTQQHGRHRGQIEVTPADQPPKLPPGFVYLATVDILPRDGRLLIGNRSYVIEKTLLQQHLFPAEQQRKVVANDGQFSGTNERQTDGGDEEQSEGANNRPSDEEGGGGQRLMDGRRPIGNATAPRGQSARRFAPRPKAFVFATTSQKVPPPPPGTLNDHFAAFQNAQNGQAQNAMGAERRTDILARHLGMTLSQIFGNFTLGNFPTKSEQRKTPIGKERTQKEEKTEPKMDIEKGGRTEEQIVSEPHRLTRVFEKKRP